MGEIWHASLPGVLDTVTPTPSRWVTRNFCGKSSTHHRAWDIVRDALKVKTKMPADEQGVQIVCWLHTCSMRLSLQIISELALGTPQLLRDKQIDTYRCTS